MNVNATENLANLFSLLRAPWLWVVCAINLQLELCSLLSVSQALLWDSLDSALTQSPSRQINAELPFLFIAMGFPIFPHPAEDQGDPGPSGIAHPLCLNMPHYHFTFSCFGQWFSPLQCEMGTKLPPLWYSKAWISVFSLIQWLIKCIFEVSSSE